MNSHADTRGQMNDPFSPGIQDQRALSEQINQTHRHLVQLHTLTSGGALEPQQMGLPHVRGFQQQMMSQPSPSGWATRDPQFLSLMQSAGLDSHDKGPSSELYEGARQYTLLQPPPFQPQQNPILSAQRSPSNVFPQKGLPLGLQVGSHRYDSTDMVNQDMMASHAQQIPGPPVIPRFPDGGVMGMGYTSAPRHVVGQYQAGLEQAGMTPSVAGQGKALYALEHSASGIHFRFPPPPLVPSNSLHSPSVRPPIAGAVSSPLSLAAAAASMPPPLVESLMRGQHEGVPGEGLRTKRLAEEQAGQGGGKQRRVMLHEEALGGGFMGGRMGSASLLCRHGNVWANCLECRGWGAVEGEGGQAGRGGHGGSEGKAGHCEHGRQRSRCKQCGGSGVCRHDRQRGTCKECRGSQICEHDRRRSLCKDCGGSQICVHQRQRSYCKDCRGSGVCEHNRRRSSCKDCGGSGICVHRRLRRQCKECGGSSICPHGRQRSLCKECGGSQICPHLKRKKQCRLCNPQHELADPALRAPPPDSDAAGSSSAPQPQPEAAGPASAEMP